MPALILMFWGWLCTGSGFYPLCSSTTAPPLHRGGWASKTMQHHWRKHVLMQGLKARLCTCPATSPGAVTICKPGGSLQHCQFYNTVNSGKIRPYIQLSNTSGKNWQLFNIVPQPLTTPYLFQCFFPPWSPWNIRWRDLLDIWLLPAAPKPRRN